MSYRWEKFIWNRCSELVVAIALILFVVLTSPRSRGAEPPRYTVENKVPKYTVVNKSTPKPEPIAAPKVSVRYVRGTDGKLYLIEERAAPAVVAPVPFPESTMATTAPASSGMAASTSGVIVNSRPSPAIPANFTSTGHVLIVDQPFGTNCPPGQR